MHALEDCFQPEPNRMQSLGDIGQQGTLLPAPASRCVQRNLVQASLTALAYYFTCWLCNIKAPGESLDRTCVAAP